MSEHEITTVDDDEVDIEFVEWVTLSTLVEQLVKDDGELLALLENIRTCQDDRGEGTRAVLDHLTEAGCLVYDRAEPKG